MEKLIQDLNVLRSTPANSSDPTVWRQRADRIRDLENLIGQRIEQEREIKGLNNPLRWHAK